MAHAIRRAVFFSPVLLIGCEQEPVLETSTSQLAPSIESRVAGFDSWIEIDLDAMGRNLERTRERTGAEVMPVVKNNAYGHGLFRRSVSDDTRVYYQNGEAVELLEF